MITCLLVYVSYPESCTLQSTANLNVKLRLMQHRHMQTSKTQECCFNAYNASKTCIPNHAQRFCTLQHRKTVLHAHWWWFVANVIDRWCNVTDLWSRSIIYANVTFNAMTQKIMCCKNIINFYGVIFLPIFWGCTYRLWKFSWSRSEIDGLFLLHVFNKTVYYGRGISIFLRLLHLNYFSLWFGLTLLFSLHMITPNVQVSCLFSLAHGIRSLCCRLFDWMMWRCCDWLVRFASLNIHELLGRCA